MPIKKYNKYFGGEKNAADKALKGMTKSYGAKKGKKVFYSTMNKRKGKGQEVRMSKHAPSMAPIRMD